MHHKKIIYESHMQIVERLLPQWPMSFSVVTDNLLTRTIDMSLIQKTLKLELNPLPITQYRGQVPSGHHKPMKHSPASSLFSEEDRPEICRKPPLHFGPSVRGKNNRLGGTCSQSGLPSSCVPVRRAGNL